ncbi:hypothetical protein H6G96_30405 [Nostoc sp. FACHB-892]|jgi:hypothetical protein|uniref:hypothetical protein n=1 Tax=unclassified Nostoc TaxID=2593658 RepID=UPI00168854CE|nr:hypothetical protein [Nostoc sp. FACHB-888]MBD2730511.1 hypothetical protein [Nostoc sp. FACHB-892]MBW4426992.1 hypothetical protein [Nostoc desertorum CM1-VF14]MBW4457689.1 hypothetical protein [Nostoc indistinguendum CM1-VF10]
MILDRVLSFIRCQIINKTKQRSLGGKSDFQIRLSTNYVVADLLSIRSQWHQAFDKVFECGNIHALPLNVRS